jgi:uncharacterized protein (TIGR02117 family)
VIKNLFKNVLKAIVIIIAFILLWLVSAIVIPYFPVDRPFIKTRERITVYVESNGVHTDFVMPVKSTLQDWGKMLPYSDFEIADPSFEYVSVGWGDKGFFIGTPTWADLKFSTAFNAAFGLSTSAMHVTYKRNSPKLSEDCRRLELTHAQYIILVNYIKNSFQSVNGKFIPIIHPGYSDYDCFYEAKGKYSLFKTCNVWTGNGLKVIGVSVADWTPLCGGVLQNLK